MKIKCPSCEKVVHAYYMPAQGLNKLVVSRHEFQPPKEKGEDAPPPEVCPLSNMVFDIHSQLEYIEDKKLYQVILE